MGIRKVPIRPLLQKVPRMNGNSVFVDDELNPWPDQWESVLQ